MKSFAAIALLTSSAAAFSTGAMKTKSSSTALSAFSAEDLPGALSPMGYFDPLSLSEGKTEAEILKFREAEVTHGRVAMLAVVGFLAGEAVEGSSFLFDSSISGPAINHLQQVPSPFFTILTLFIGGAELFRAVSGWVSPIDSEYEGFGTLRSGYIPGDIGFDPLGLKPDDSDELMTMQTKELQNGRLAMLAAAGFIAQELVNGKGILDNLLN